MSFTKNVSTVLLVVLCCLGLFCVPVCADSYILGKDGSTHIPTPKTYTVTGLFSDFGEKGGTLNKPSDLFIAEDDSVYIADTGNNRIVKLSADGQYIRNYTDSGRLCEPKGVFVQGDDIYVSDTANERIVHLDAEDHFIEEFVKPVSPLLDEDMDFQVGRIAIGHTGYLYVTRGQYFLKIDAENNFQGYTSTTKVGFSLINTLVRLFGSKSQKEKIITVEPTSYMSFDIGSDGVIYATMSGSEKTGQIQAINFVEKNIYPVKTYGEKVRNKKNQNLDDPVFVDIATTDGSLIYVLEQFGRHIYVYDKSGQLITAFGGAGTVKGRFSIPVALDVNSKNDVFVLDQQTGYVHMYSTTAFMEDIRTAINYFDNGHYEEAAVQWKNVLDTNANYDVANYSLAHCYYKFGNYDKAAELYKQAGDIENYGKAFTKQRHEFFKNHFVVLVASIAALIVVVLIGCLMLKKGGDRCLAKYVNERGLTNRTPMSIGKHILLTIVHPLDNIDILKNERKKKSTWVAIPVFLALTILINYGYSFYVHYSLDAQGIEGKNILLEMAMVLVPFFSWTITAFAISSTKDGESTIGQQLLCYAYALVPYIALKPLLGLLSRVLSSSEGELYNLLLTVALGWTLLLLFASLQRLNDYSLSKAVAVTLLAILLMLIMWAVLLLLFSLVIQVVTFAQGIFEEFSLKFLNQ